MPRVGRLEMNIYDIARLAGVSRKTVQRAVNDSPSVKPETREKIRRIMEEHHYEPNEIARKLSNKKSSMIGIFIVQDAEQYHLHADDLYYGAVIGGIINQCTYKGYKTIITILDRSDPEPLFSMFRQKIIDAGIIVSWSNVQELVERAAGAGFKIAVFDQNNVPSPPAGVPIPMLDNRRSAYRAGRYLLEQGHTELGIITGSMDIPCSGDRLEGFRQALRESGIGLNESAVYYGRFTERDGELAVEAWISSGNLPQAIFCSNDLMAYGALKTLLRHDVSVPEEVSVIGFDDLLISQYMHPPLTTMRVPRVEMAEAMTAEVIRSLDGAVHLQSLADQVFEAELMVRGSCSPAVPISRKTR
jgi:LacI family transcriptional regulator